MTGGQTQAATHGDDLWPRSEVLAENLLAVPLRVASPGGHDIPVDPMDAGTVTPVGGLEIADRLGVKRETVAMWKQRGLLPPARWTVSGEDAWDWLLDIEPWARQTGRLRTAPELR